MRQAMIRGFLPFCFFLLPFAAAVLVAACVQREAMEYFLQHIGPMEMLILGLGGLLFVLQMALCWQALRWRGSGFDERSDQWISHLAQAAEWFPLLGLLGTVAGILQAFQSARGAIPPSVIAPAITATGAGLFMAFINILPTWMVMTGRDLILTLSGDAPPAPAAPPGDAV